MLWKVLERQKKEKFMRGINVAADLLHMRTYWLSYITKVYLAKWIYFSGHRTSHKYILQNKYIYTGKRRHNNSWFGENKRHKWLINQKCDIFRSILRNNSHKFPKQDDMVIYTFFPDDTKTMNKLCDIHPPT